MRQYFIEKPLKENDIIGFSDEVQHHIRDVLRMKTDDKIRLVDSDSRLFLAHLLFLNNDVKAYIDEEIQGNTNENDIIFCPCLVKKEKWDMILQKAAELGATKIVPVISQYTIIHMDEKEVEKKLPRWNKITLEACQQSNRTQLCEVTKPVKLKQLKNFLSEVNLVPYEKENVKYLWNMVDGRSITFVIGPEGGFSKEEIEYLNSIGFDCCSLGKRILRAETAGLYTLSVIDAKRNSL